MPQTEPGSDLAIRERLRHAYVFPNDQPLVPLLAEAADEIERLQLLLAGLEREKEDAAMDAKERDFLD